MAEKPDLFTIGEFSKITGVGIHSLRYYDDIGALKPEYVDPVSNYRYYSFDQLRKIPGINICLDAGIKLSEFDQFLDDDSVNYEKLIRESRAAIDRKIDEFQMQKKQLCRIENLLKIREESVREESFSIHSGGYDLWTIPYGKTHISDESDILVKISSHARSRGCQISPVCFGLLQSSGGPDHEIRAFALIQDLTPTERTRPYVFHLEEGEYLIKACDCCSIYHARDLLHSPEEQDKEHVFLSFILVGDKTAEKLYFASASVPQ